MEEEKKATAEETIRGTVWRWPHSTERFSGLKAAPYEVRNIPEKKVVIILCQDGVAGWEYENPDDEDDEELVERLREDKLVEDEIQKLAGDLLRFRWEEVSLMDAIVTSQDFAEGDFKGGLEAGFKSVDEKVAEFVKVMPTEISNKVVDWSEPLLWQAQFNTVAVIITPEEVYTAGCGSFAARVISSNDVRLISKPRAGNSEVKALLAEGVPPAGDLERELTNARVRAARASTVEVTSMKYHLEEEDECIVVEQSTILSRKGGKFWLRHGKDWEAALTSISEVCQTEKVASPLLLSPTKMARRPSSVSSPSKMVSPLKRLKTAEPLPPLVTV